MRVLGFGTYDIGKHPRVGIILDGLRDHGHDVVEINAPLGFSTAERVAMLRAPWTAYRFVLRLLRRWLTLARAGRRARRRGRPDAVIVGYLGHFDVVLARLIFPRERIALDQMIFAADSAVDRGVRSGLKLRLLRGIDSLAVHCADLVLLDTDEQVELLAPAQRHKAVVVPVGSPTNWFDAGQADAAPPGAPLRVVFYGLFTPLQGTTVIGAALAELSARDDIEVTMIGSGQDWQATRDAAGHSPNVRWQEWVQPDALPAAVAAHDVCLGIFGMTPKAGRVVPNKVYQGAAAGCAVVTSDTAPQRRALGADAVFVPAGSPHALAEALVALAEDRDRLAAMRAAATRRSRAQFTPSEIVIDLRRRLTDRVPEEPT